MSFDPLVATTSRAEWDATDRWRDVGRVSAEWLAGFEGITVLAAHPDDETLGAGGLISLCTELGVPVSVVVATTSEPARADELRTALRRLGTGTDAIHLGLTDGGLKHETDELRRALEPVLAPIDAPHLVLAPWPGDRHGDHRTLGQEAAKSCAGSGHTLRFYPIWLWQWGRPDDMPWSRAVEVELTEAIRERKRTALAAFATQLHSDANPDGVLAPGFVERAVRGPEVLIEPEADPLGTHFERIHRRSSDPWSVRTRWYERRKRALTLAVLPRERYQRGLELGCSNGELAADLAERCDALVAVDAAEAAAALASERTASLPSVSVRRLHAPDEWPEGRFDLIVVSEVAYYLTADQWETTIDRIAASRRPDGIVVLCHWTGRADDFVQSGVQAHERFAARSGLRRTVAHLEDDFALEVYG